MEVISAISSTISLQWKKLSFLTWKWNKFSFYIYFALSNYFHNSSTRKQLNDAILDYFKDNRQLIAKYLAVGETKILKKLQSQEKVELDYSGDEKSNKQEVA